MHVYRLEHTVPARHMQNQLLPDVLWTQLVDERVRVVNLVNFVVCMWYLVQ